MANSAGEESILLLTYFLAWEDQNAPALKYVKEHFLGAYLNFEDRFVRPLQTVFSKVWVFDYLKRRTQVSHQQLNQEILELVRRERPTYVLWTSFYYDVAEATLKAVAEEDVIVV